jgi:hypothetical protein
MIAGRRSGRRIERRSDGLVPIGVTLVFLPEFHDDLPVVAQVDASCMETEWPPRISGWTTPTQLQPNSPFFEG